MEIFREQFLIDSVKNLKRVLSGLPDTPDFSVSQRQEIFRTLHTIKGTAQTFGFSAASRLAHETENILSAENINSNAGLRALLAEGIELLIDSFEQDKFEVPARFAENIYNLIPAHPPSVAQSNLFPPEIQSEILDCLSQTEKAALSSAIRSEKTIYIVEAGFDIKSFTVEVKKFRQYLEAAGEIIATFPSAKFNSGTEIGFQILLANSAVSGDIVKIAEIFGGDIILKISPENFTNDLSGVALKAVAHGRNLAKRLGKEVEFDVSVGQSNCSAETLKLVFDILLHLIRNAVDHAVENTGGKIKVKIRAEKDGLRIMAADNGRGINLEKIRAKAVEKKIISPADNLTEQATLDLVFQSELSIAPQLTEISGRGIGLDAVKNTVEKAGGKIKVQSRAGQGTSFEIFLPN